MSVSIGKRIGEGLILSVYLVVDALDVWPKSHFGCLVLVMIGVLGILLFDGMFESAFPIKRVTILGSITAVACVIVYFVVPLIAERPTPQVPVTTPTAIPSIPLEDSEVQGVLKPANEPTPPNACDGDRLRPNTLKVLIGDNVFASESFMPFSVIQIGTCDALTIQRGLDGGLFINASLYDPEKQAVVSIKNNRVTALNGEHYTARQSRDESRLTARNSRGDELFYIRYLNPTTVQFRGFLGCSGGSIIRVQDGQPVPGLFLSHSCTTNSRAGIQIIPSRRPVTPKSP